MTKEVKKRGPYKKRAKGTAELPLGDAPGVVGIVIQSIDTMAQRYEAKKNLRCEASPGEIAAKRDLREELHKHRGKLPVNEKGERFYRTEGVDYILTEGLKRQKADDGEADQERL